MPGLLTRDKNHGTRLVILLAKSHRCKYSNFYLTLKTPRGGRDWIPPSGQEIACHFWMGQVLKIQILWVFQEKACQILEAAIWMDLDVSYWKNISLFFESSSLIASEVNFFLGFKSWRSLWLLFVSNEMSLELVSKELNHLAAILHVYAGGLIFMK